MWTPHAAKNLTRKVILELPISKISTLNELYIHELKDLWSANDQMVKALEKIIPQARNKKLVSMLKASHKGIASHTELIKSLIENQEEDVGKSHCQGMEGLVKEAIKHMINDAPDEGPVLDAAIIAQYQRMTHYGITGFGTVTSFAKALKLTGDRLELEMAVKEMQKSDE